MLRFLLVLVLSFRFVFSQVNWVNRGRVPDPSGYFSKVVQELVYDLEKLEWCNLKVDEYSQTLNEQLYQWHVNGTVTYSKGFVISIRELEVTKFEQLVTSSTVNGVSVPRATVRGILNMYDVKIGFNVQVDLQNTQPPHSPQQWYTSHYTHQLIAIRLEVTRNLLTKEMTSSPTSVTVTTDNRMIYRPANNLTEVLSRRYLPRLNGNAVNQWCRNIIGPMLVDISTNRVAFPDICFNNCPR